MNAMKEYNNNNKKKRSKTDRATDRIEEEVFLSPHMNLNIISLQVSSCNGANACQHFHSAKVELRLIKRQPANKIGSNQIQYSRKGCLFGIICVSHARTQHTRVMLIKCVQLKQKMHWRQSDMGSVWLCLCSYMYNNNRQWALGGYNFSHYNLSTSNSIVSFECWNGF